MNMIDDVKEFKRLSISYRESHDDIDKQNKIERDIKFLVDGTVQRMSESFGITLNQEVKNVTNGMPFFPHSSKMWGHSLAGTAIIT